MSDNELMFDSTPDAELGALLLTGLSASDQEGFQRRIMASLVADARERSWEILARWARPGLVAAGLAAAALLGVVLGRAMLTPVESGVAPVQELIAGQPSPSGEILLSAVLEGR